MRKASLDFTLWRIAPAVVALLCFSFAGPAQAGPLNDYNLIVFGDLDSQSEVEGKAFIGGDLLGTASNFGTMLSIPAAEVSLQVGGSILANIENINAGSIEVGGNIGAGTIVNMNSGGNYAVGGTIFGTVNNGAQIPLVTPPDVTAIQNQLLADSTAYAGLAPNSTASIQNGNQLVFDANPMGPQNRAVFDVSASDIFENNTLSQLIVNPNGADEIIINVSGTGFTWNNGMNPVGDLLTDAVREIVVWNFFEATSINLHRNFNGALLAPLAHLSNFTNIDGSVAVDSFTQRGEVHLPTSTVPPIPEPTSAVLALLALPGMLFWRWRRSKASRVAA